MSGAVAAAAANGDVRTLTAVVERGESPDARGPDGTLPLCAAVMWGQEAAVQALLELRADVRATSAGAMWTALHAACLQESGKVAMMLLEAGADPMQPDTEGVTPVDFASCSDAVWPFFAAKGCARTGKEELIAKKVIRKTASEEPAPADTGMHGTVAHVSRPGSSYVVSHNNPARPKTQQSAPIDILAGIPEAAPAKSFGRTGLGAFN
jgi:hypothetical protein